MSYKNIRYLSKNTGIYHSLVGIVVTYFLEGESSVCCTMNTNKMRVD